MYISIHIYIYISIYSCKTPEVSQGSMTVSLATQRPRRSAAKDRVKPVDGNAPVMKETSTASSGTGLIAFFHGR